MAGSLLRQSIQLQLEALIGWKLLHEPTRDTNPRMIRHSRPPLVNASSWTRERGELISSNFRRLESPTHYHHHQQPVPPSSSSSFFLSTFLSSSFGLYCSRLSQVLLLVRRLLYFDHGPLLDYSAYLTASAVGVYIHAPNLLAFRDWAFFHIAVL